MKPTQERIEELIQSDKVFLFMKGNPSFPQCGFSATVVQILRDVGVTFKSENVLSDPEIRDGVKQFSDWPTIPQLYVDGKFVGGCDIIKSLYESGEIYKTFGLPEPEQKPMDITITDAAKAAIETALADAAEGELLRLSIDASFEHGLEFDKKTSADEETTSNGISVLVDRSSAARAVGVTIDFVDADGGGGFKIDNVSAPQSVQRTSPAAMKDLLDQKKIARLLDVRTAEERDICQIEGSEHLDEALLEEISGLDKNTVLAFYCHHGQRSAGAAEHFLRLGFRNVHNLEGGIDAWAAQIDKDLQRY